jgi:hypothetical protein
MTTDQIVGAVVTAWPVLGAIGTVIETIGKAFALPKLVAVGSRIEAIFVDFPKVIKGTPPQ